MPTGVYKRTKPGWNKGLTKETDVRVARNGVTISAVLIVKHPKPILEPKLCKCGCGEYAKPGKRFIHGHHWRGKKQSEKTKELISLCRSCNSKVNYNREYWMGFFQAKLG